MISPLLFSIYTSLPQAASRPVPKPVAAGIRRVAAGISAWLERGAERRRLQSLSDHMLRDFGVSRRDIER